MSIKKVAILTIFVIFLTLFDDKFDMDIKCQEFWIRTNKILKEERITQENLCNVTGINYQTLKGWITHGRYPDAEQICKIADCLKVSVNYLVTGIEKDIPQDIQLISAQLMQFSAEEREPIITMISGQIDYWKKILNK